VPASLAPRQRKRRFPERELLERIRLYEGLLQQNDIKFEPLHVSAPTDNQKAGTNRLDAHSKAATLAPGQSVSPDAESRSGTLYEAK